MDSQILRSKALNNIPIKKLELKRAGLLLDCDICGKNPDVTFESGACSKCRIMATAYQRYYEANIPIEYWSLTMSKDFHGFEKLRELFDDYVSNMNTYYGTGKSFCLAGNHGLGKTMTSTCILKQASLKNYNCLYTTLSDVVSVLTSSDSEEKFLARKELVTVDFLVLDEFDSRFFSTENAADLYARTLESVFRTRSMNRLPTIMCTNSPNILQAFTGALKLSIESLMKGYLKIIPIFGEDYRVKLGQGKQ